MRRMQFFAASLAVFLVGAGAAQATTAETSFDISYYFSYMPAPGEADAPGLTNYISGLSGCTASNPCSVTETLANHQVTSPTQFMTISPAKCPGCEGTVSGTVSVYFTVTDLTTNQTVQETANGLYQANYGSTGLKCSVTGSGAQADCIDWGVTTAPKNVYTTPLNLAFDFTGASLSIVLNDYSDWNLEPKVYFTDPATPLPAALPLFAAGIGVFGLAGAWRRRRFKANAAA
jgi:hypothetical protein